MSVRVVPDKKKPGTWEVDVRVDLPNGEQYRKRKRGFEGSRTNARKWGEEHHRLVLQNGPRADRQKEVPTLEQFAGRFIEGHARANRQKPSGIAAKETIFRHHLIPFLGSTRLDAISTEQVQRLKLRLDQRSRKTVNNVVSVLNTMLKKAVEWGVIDAMPCTIKLLPVAKGHARFYDFDELERLFVLTDSDPQARLVVLLGAKAGLRCGEMMALEWRDIDIRSRRLEVARSEWKGRVTLPKGGRSRFVPLVADLVEALQKARHLRGARVLCQADGQPLTQKVVQGIMRRLARAANLTPGVHVLRHTFCSHLAMRGVPARSIQELAGHEDLSTTLRYMHLSPRAIEDAMLMLERQVG